MDDIGGAAFIEDGRARRPCQVHVGRWLQDQQGDRRACGRRLAACQPGVHEDVYLVPRHAWFAGRKPTLAYRLNRGPQIHARHVDHSNAPVLAPKSCEGVMITTDALPQMGLDPCERSAVRQLSVRTLSPWRMNWPSEQSLEEKLPAPSSVRLAATSTKCP